MFCRPGARSQSASILSSLQEVKDVQDNLKEKEAQLQDVERQLAGLKGTAEKYGSPFLSESDAVALELEELQREQAGYEQQIQAVDEATKAIQEQIDSMACTEAVRKAQEELTKQKDVIMSQDKELKEKSTEVNRVREKNNEAQLKIKELEHNISKHHRESQDAADKVTRMLEEHDWIHSERQFFGQPNTSYDFKTNNPREAGQRLKKLEETTSKLERNVNKRAMNMLNEAEERIPTTAFVLLQYNDLMKKKRIVENDKAKILQTIKELDQKKNEALNLAWQKGCGVLDGLEFKVALGDTWKENLTELSGGQRWVNVYSCSISFVCLCENVAFIYFYFSLFNRSLVALSLILAMLLFKPAPIYILDEVDAALDLSHTQNIGQMLRSHFTHSQFVVVSLKDGMFTNANVLFKTKFVDGMSTVSRTALSQSDSNVPLKGQDKARQKERRNKQLIS
ncbi:Structural maintenance of chromosomes protein 2 [Goodea atripinnis]|uniref:Structural maintenance of chromosomes protein 2 n=1 Tax=Goodea atripinnis TaxID=208336 RepID=A0ABV0N8G8_9TELE